MDKMPFECPKVETQPPKEEKVVECTWESVPDDFKELVNTACYDYDLTNEQKFAIYKETISKIAFETLCFVDSTQFNIEQGKNIINLSVINLDDKGIEDGN